MGCEAVLTLQVLPTVEHRRALRLHNPFDACVWCHIKGVCVCVLAADFLLGHSTSSQIMIRRLLISFECSVLFYACSTSSYNLNCFSSSTFCLGLLTFLPFSISYFHRCLCLAGWWLPGFSGHVPLFPLFSSLLSHSELSPPTYSLCTQALPSPLLPSCWPFNFLLDQTGALGRQGETATHLS